MSYDIPNLLKLSDGSNVNLKMLRSNNEKSCVIDLWHTKCTRCPAALDKLNTAAEENPDISFVSICLSQGDKNFELAVDMVEDTWESITHCFVDVDTKEKMKVDLGFTAVPFYIVCNKDGDIIIKGDSKVIDLPHIIQQLKTPPATVTTTITNGLEMDEDF